MGIAAGASPGGACTGNGGGTYPKSPFIHPSPSSLGHPSPASWNGFGSEFCVDEVGWSWMGLDEASPHHPIMAGGGLSPPKAPPTPSS